ncbi:ent-kaurenoic acid oxidase 2-like [Amaranthus tricolor]|uniref:ent-kaurenoic acid oxidase 2-like n=1 Tax=Amaranthus tricolor TaxID=29722 RepID=UPI002587C8A5|nr:ent-kaurenoic acid oxidase 2-like [Amaranthus tricolor]
MEIRSSIWLIFSVVLGGLVAVYGFLKTVNEWFYVRRLGKKRHLLPPGDMGWPFMGTQLSFLKAFKSKNPDSFISNFAARFGTKGIYKAMMFGKPCVIVTTPESCKRVLSDDTTFGPGFPESITKLMGKKAFHGISSEEHKRLRRLTTAALSGQEALSIYISHIEQIVTTSLEEWASMSRPIEFLTEMRKIAFKVIMYVMVGETSTDQSIMEALEKEYTTLNHGLKSMAIDFPGFAYHSALKARKNLQKIFQSVVDKRRLEKTASKKEEKTDMLDMLMGTEDENGGKLSDEEIVDLIIMFLNAGHESSGHAAMWAVVLLQDHPEIFQKAKEEQEQIVNKRLPNQKGLTLKETRQMEYLSKVIDETLRVVNISFTLFREATKDVNINGYIVPKGWRILTWLRSAHLDSEKYLNPKQFDPSRWDDPKTRVNFIPFGAGSRLCPGRDLARLEVYTFLHYFLLNYKLERVNSECPIRYLPISRPVDNCLARIIRSEP